MQYQIRNSLFLLDSIAKIPAQQRIQPEEFTFHPQILSPDIPVETVAVDASIVDRFKQAVGNSQQYTVFALYNDLYLDKSLLVRALIESAIEFVNAGSPATMAVVFKTVRENMRAEDVIAVTNLIMRAKRSTIYNEFVTRALTETGNQVLAYAKEMIEGRILVDAQQFPKEYLILNSCDPKYRPYAIFASYFDNTDEPVVLSKLNSKMKKKAAEMEALR